MSGPHFHDYVDSRCRHCGIHPWGQDTAMKNIKIIIKGPPGSGTWAMARIITEALQAAGLDFGVYDHHLVFDYTNDLQKEVVNALAAQTRRRELQVTINVVQEARCPEPFFIYGTRRHLTDRGDKQ